MLLAIDDMCLDSNFAAMIFPNGSVLGVCLWMMVSLLMSNGSSWLFRLGVAPYIRRLNGTMSQATPPHPPPAWMVKIRRYGSIHSLHTRSRPMRPASCTCYGTPAAMSVEQIMMANISSQRTVDSHGKKNWFYPTSDLIPLNFTI
jgi:hypothetical protein